jgi:hypothetical protein
VKCVIGMPVRRCPCGGFTRHRHQHQQSGRGKPLQTFANTSCAD